MKSFRLAVRFTIKVVAPVCGCANATSTPKYLTFSPAHNENPESKFLEYMLISVRVLWLYANPM